MSTKKAIKKTETVSTSAAKTTKSFEEAKKLVNELSSTLNKSVLALPSLVFNKEGKPIEANGLIENKFEIDIEMIRMLEYFFERLVQLLNLRASYDQKIFKITKMLKHIKEIKTPSEFKGNLQLIGIGLNELEQIAKNYQEVYTDIFTEQAMLQFQLMEQLMLIRDKDIIDFTSSFKIGLELFYNLNKKIAELKE